jgi:molecular chaperone GrpE
MCAEDISKQNEELEQQSADPTREEQSAVGLDATDAEKNKSVFASIFAKKKDKTADGALSDQEAQDANAAAEAENAEAAEPDHQAQIADLTDKLLRSRAEFDNYRKRITREFGDVREQAKQRTVAEFLSVYDYFILAVKHMETSSDIGSIKQGMQMILTEFARSFEALGVKEINAEGQPFDARFHEAVAQEASASVPEGTVIRQWKSGFTVGENLLRAATVVVSSGNAVTAATEDAAADADAGEQENP